MFFTQSPRCLEPYAGRGSTVRRLALVAAVVAMLGSACATSGSIDVEAQPATSEAATVAPPTTTPVPAASAVPETPTAGADPDPDSGASGAVVIEGRFERTGIGCTFDEPDGVEVSCYRVKVPERWDLDNDGDAVELNVAVFMSPTADDNTIVYLEGGPGGDALQTASLSWASIWADIAAEHPVVIFDQRGTGASEPSLQCDEVVALTGDLLVETDPQVVETLNNNALTACFDRLRDGGVDLSGYNSVQNSHDVEAIRLALELDPWNVVGVSYGTRLGQTLLREHPDGVRSIVLDAVLPIDGSEANIPSTAERSFTEQFAACADDAGCSAEYGDVEARFWAVVDQLDDDPVEFEAFNPITAEIYDVVWNGDALISAVFQLGYGRDTIADVPLLISQLEDRDTTGAATLTGLFAAQADFISVGMFWAVTCHEEVPLTDAAAYPAGLSTNDRINDVFASGQSNPTDAGEICALVDAGVADEIEDEAVVSAIPSLVLSGHFDPITPPAFGDDVADDLENSTHVVLPNMGHGAISHECGRSMINAFVTEPTAAVDSSCIDDIEALSWLGPEPATGVETYNVFSPFGDAIAIELPAGWEALPAAGAITESGSILRSAVVFAFTAPDGQGAALVDILFSTFSADAADGGTVEVDGTTWSVTNGRIPGSTFDAWVGDRDGTTFVVLLQAAPSEQERLVDDVIPLALETVRLDG